MLKSKEINLAEIATKHQAFSQEMKTYRFHEVVTLWLKVNSENLDFEELSDEICGFVDDVIGDHVMNPHKLKLNKELW